MNWYDAKSDSAARLRQRKYALLRILEIPPDALPGSLALTHNAAENPPAGAPMERDIRLGL